MDARSRETSTGGIGEDWLAVVLGLSVFVVALAGLLGQDMLGWVVTTRVWNESSGALAPVAKAPHGVVLRL